MAPKFPNVAVMARQPGSTLGHYMVAQPPSASVERLFSQVSLAYSDKRRSATAPTVQSIMFAQQNLSRV